jgi:hypothetical protein
MPSVFDTSIVVGEHAESGARIVKGLCVSHELQESRVPTVWGGGGGGGGHSPVTSGIMITQMKTGRCFKLQCLLARLSPG